MKRALQLPLINVKCRWCPKGTKKKLGALRAKREKAYSLYMHIFEEDIDAKERQASPGISARTIFQTYTRCVGLLYRVN